jgi:hypothetical protein
MKKIFFTLAFSGILISALSQSKSAITTTPVSQPAMMPALDKSPMDMAYFPNDYPLQKTQNKVIAAPLVRVIYSRPQKDNRVIFGDLIEYDKVWRLGANEATEIEFFKDAVIGGKKIIKGRYTLYAIPSAAKWTIIINRDTDSWGAFVYDQKKDALRTDVPVQNLVTPMEVLSMNFIKTEKGTSLVMAWDNASVSLPIDIK